MYIFQISLMLFYQESRQTNLPFDELAEWYLQVFWRWYSLLFKRWLPDENRRKIWSMRLPTIRLF